MKSIAWACFTLMETWEKAKKEKKNNKKQQKSKNLHRKPLGKAKKSKKKNKNSKKKILENRAQTTDFR